MATAIKWGDKDPDATRDFGINWAPDLPDTVTITASTWLLDGAAWTGSSLVKVADSFTDTNTTVRISGGTVGTTYLVTNHIVMSDGEEDDFSQKLKIKER